MLRLVKNWDALEKQEKVNRNEIKRKGRERKKDSNARNIGTQEMRALHKKIEEKRKNN